MPLPVSIDGLRAHVSASYAYALAASALDTVFADPASTATLASVLDHYGVDWQALGLAADERTLGSLVQVPSTASATMLHSGNQRCEPIHSPNPPQKSVIHSPFIAHL